MILSQWNLWPALYVYTNPYLSQTQSCVYWSHELSYVYPWMFSCTVDNYFQLINLFAFIYRYYFIWTCILAFSTFCLFSKKSYKIVYNCFKGLFFSENLYTHSKIHNNYLKLAYSRDFKHSTYQEIRFIWREIHIYPRTCLSS